MLLDDWKRIARKAWSMRLGAFAAVMSGAEVVVPIFSDSIPRDLFAVLSFVAVAGAMFARLIAQPKMRDDE
jgi:hypothetical protein